MAKLLLKFGPAIVKEYPIPPTQTAVSIGRKPENDIVVDNPIVSGKHAQIIKLAEQYFIEDLNSTNGTFIGGKRIIKCGLNNGDEVVIGSHSIVFQGETTAPTQPPPQKPASLDQTMVMDPSKRDELLRKTAAASAPTTSAGKIVEKTGTLVVTSGSIGRPDFELTGLVTYVGTSGHAHIRIKGLFATDMAAAINKRQEGYVLVALKDGFPEVNGQKLTGQTLLQDGDEIKMGGITFRFYIKETTK